MANNPLFRRSEKTVNGIEIFNSQPFSDSSPHDRLVTLGKVSGFQYVTGPYNFRRRNGEPLNSSSKS